MASDFDEFDHDLEELNRQLEGDDENNELPQYPDDSVIEFELNEVEMRTAVMSKNDMIALLCLKTADKGGAICRVDPREENPSVQLYDDADKALEWFTKSLKTSRKNGWNIVYDGLPLEG